jgi:hypothetical protein
LNFNVIDVIENKVIPFIGKNKKNFIEYNDPKKPLLIYLLKLQNGVAILVDINYVYVQQLIK